MLASAAVFDLLAVFLLVDVAAGTFFSLVALMADFAAAVGVLALRPALPAGLAEVAFLLTLAGAVAFAVFVVALVLLDLGLLVVLDLLTPADVAPEAPPARAAGDCSRFRACSARDDLGDTNDLSTMGRTSRLR